MRPPRAPGCRVAGGRLVAGSNPSSSVTSCTPYPLYLASDVGLALDVGAMTVFLRGVMRIRGKKG